MQAGMIEGSSPSTSSATTTVAPSGIRSSTRAMPSRATSRAGIRWAPQPRASATSPDRAEPSARMPTCTIRSTWGSSDDRRMPDDRPRRSSCTSSRQSIWASICRMVTGPCPAKASIIGKGSESSPPSRIGTAPWPRIVPTAPVTRARLAAKSSASKGRSPASTTSGAPANIGAPLSKSKCPTIAASPAISARIAAGPPAQ